MCCENIHEELQDIEWVQIPGTVYIAKYKFLENEYKILVTNLTEMFGECLQETEIQTRFLNNNPYAEMKTKVIIKNIKETLENIETDGSPIMVNSSARSLNIQLSFTVHQVSFLFNLEPALLPSEKLRTQVIIPTLSYALLLNQENLALQKKIKELENKIGSASVSRTQVSNSETNVFANYSHVSETNMLEVFIKMQNNSKKLFQDKEKLNKEQEKTPNKQMLPSQMSPYSQRQSNSTVLQIKREVAEISEFKPEIKYEEACFDNLKTEDSQTTSVQSTDVKMKRKKKYLNF